MDLKQLPLVIAEEQAKSDGKGGASTITPSEPKAQPLDLSAHYFMKADQFVKNQIVPAWDAVPRGPHTFLDIPLEIGGNVILWGEENAKRGQVYAKEIEGIKVERKFETLYILHATFFEVPEGTEVYAIVFSYEDGTSEEDSIKSIEDVRDWYGNHNAPITPTSDRSKLAWHGNADNNGRKQPLRFFLTAIENPRPDVRVTSIDLVSSKSRAAGCILAMTTGKSGLIP